MGSEQGMHVGGGKGNDGVSSGGINISGRHAMQHARKAASREEQVYIDSLGAEQLGCRNVRLNEPFISTHNCFFLRGGSGIAPAQGPVCRFSFPASALGRAGRF
jgi:hypothetical protein